MEYVKNEDEGFHRILDERKGLLGNMTHVLQPGIVTICCQQYTVTLLAKP